MPAPSSPHQVEAARLAAWAQLWAKLLTPRPEEPTPAAQDPAPAADDPR